MKSLLFTGLAAVTVVSASANAGIVPGDTLTLSRIGTAGLAIRFDYDASRTAGEMPSGYSQFGLAGMSFFNNLTSGGTVQTFCVEMNEGFPDDPITYTVTELTGVPEETPPGNMSQMKADYMSDLYARWYALARPVNEDLMAAFQLVVWEISHENWTTKSDLDITVGAMSITDYNNANVLDYAIDMIDSLDGTMRMDSVLGLTNPSNQDMLIVVPSPAIAGLAGLGLAGMRRRRR